MVGGGVGVGILAKLAVAERSWSILTEHRPVPLQAPDQPVNSYPSVSWKVTTTKESNSWPVVPEGNTAPPSLANVTSRNDFFWKETATSLCLFMVNPQDPAPPQSPPQLFNSNPTLGRGVSETIVPSRNGFSPGPGAGPPRSRRLAPQRWLPRHRHYAIVAGQAVGRNVRLYGIPIDSSSLQDESNPCPKS